MEAGEYLAGLAFFCGIWGAAAYVAWVVLRRRLPELAGVERAVALALLFLGALLLVHIVPGSLDLLTRAGVLATALVAAAAVHAVPARPGFADRSPPPPPLFVASRISLLVAGGAVAAVSIYAVAIFAGLATVAPAHIDSLTFGLPGIAHWIRTESLWDTGAFAPLFQIRTYPNNGDLVYLASILPWSGDAFVRFPTLPLLGMTGLGVYAIGRELRAPVSIAALIAALTVSIEAISVPALQHIKPDVFMYATFATGLLFLLRSIRTGSTADVVMAGLGLGLAFGSRWYGISSVLVVVAVWAGGLLLARLPARRVLRQAGVLCAVVIAAGGYWFVRNAVLTGNPLYPIKVAPFGVTVLDAPRDILIEKIGLTIVDRLDQPGVWREAILPSYADVIGAPGLVILIGTLAAIALGLTRRAGGRPSDGIPLGLAAAALGLVAAYAITPASAQGFEDLILPHIVGGNARWLMPALLVGAAATTWALTRLGRGRLAAEAAALLAVIISLAAGYGLTALQIGRAVLALAVTAGLGALGVAAWRRLAGPSRRAAAGAAALVALAAAAAAGYADQQAYYDSRFNGQSRVLDWVLRNAPDGHRVAIAGGWAPTFVATYGMFGPQLGNDVAYVGPIVDGQLREYTRADAFREALQRGGYDVLLVGRVQDPDLDRPRPLVVSRHPREARWAKAAGFTRVAGDEQYVLLVTRSLGTGGPAGSERPASRGRRRAGRA
ncbi:MAG: hypothetical protein ACR2G3_12930 [Solirubrobacterales bacterium]